MKKNNSTLLLLLFLALGIQGISQETGLRSYYKVSDTQGSFDGALDNTDLFGYEVEGIGDLNGDGIEDLAVNAYKDDDGLSDAGAIWILFLNLDGSVQDYQKISNTEGDLGSILHSGERFGNAIENIGDLDGDGVTDLAVGAFNSGNGGVGKGVVYVLFMRDTGSVKSVQEISQSTGGFGGTLDAYDAFGTSIANMGDLDGDGVIDLAVGAYGDDDGGSARGALWILFMNTDGTVKDEQKISDLEGGFETTLTDNDRFGYGIDNIGDLNGDGVNDLSAAAIYDDDGNTNAGAVYILFMTDSGYVKEEQKISATEGDFAGTLDASDVFGVATQFMGDIDGDGYTNLMVSARNDDDGGTNRGAVWVVNLNTDGTVRDEQKVSDTLTIFNGNLGDSDWFGASASMIGDINNDGYLEFVVGTPQDDDGSTDRGAIYELTFNGPKTLAPLIKFSTKISDTEGSFDGDFTNSDLFGYASEGIGDLNGDGVEDVVVNSFKDDDGATDAGAIWVLFLDYDGSVKDYQKISNLEGDLGSYVTLSASERFGNAIANIGDLDGDGVTDLAVGAQYNNDAGTQKGCVYILFMRDTGSVKSVQQITESTGGFGGTLDYYDLFGTSLANIGDLDGDGINDLAVGAYGDDDEGSARGAVWILFMDTDGTVKSEQKISDTYGGFTTTLTNDDRFGYGLTCLGDLDNDGINDIMVGAPQDDDGGTGRGAVYVLFLDTDGTVKSEQKISNLDGGFGGILTNSDVFGLDNEYLGDINGDGYIDVLVAAKNDDDGGTNKGAVWILSLKEDGTVKSYSKISELYGGFGEDLDNSDFFGKSLANIGDINNDGTIEFVIGAQSDDDGGTDRGAIYILSTNNLLNPEVDGQIAHRTASDLTYNWSYTESYDEDGKVIGKSKQYVDELGRNTQSLVQNFEKNKVIATQTIYDSYGRPVINTMPAPIGQSMGYKSNFVTNTAGVNYGFTDFDTENKINNPNALDTNYTNTLGRYYSEDSEEAFQATTSFPYSRIEYMADPTGRVKRTSAPGEDFKMGSGHESKMYYMFTGGELDKVYGQDSSFYVQTNSSDRLESSALSNLQIVAEKTISLDAEGNIAISFKSDGLLIASCVSGKTIEDTVVTQTASSPMLYAGTQAVDIHLPKVKYNTLKLPLPTYFNGESTVSVLKEDMSHTIIDLESDTIITAYTLDSTSRLVTFSDDNRHRFLRITFSYKQSRIDYWESNNITPPNASVTYDLDYSHFTTNYYDLTGRLRKNVSPKGFREDGNHTELSKYDYDPYGQLIAKETPDEGLMEYLYSDEGVVRFSQNAQQAVDGKFSYVRYDEYNRSIESGEYDETGAVFEFAGYYDTASSGTDVKDTINTVGFDFNDTYCSNQSYVAYDLLASTAEIPAGYSYKSQYEQHNLKARVSKTWNDYNQTWYSYDYAGRPEYTVQQLLDADFDADTTADVTLKTVDYTYTPLTSLLIKEEYQKNHATEEITHDFTYNNNQQLIAAVATKSNDTIGQAAFDYYINGQLKRKELGGTLQGMDYVYTLHGQLKSINHPSLHEDYDPGQDDFAGSANEDFKSDVFGMALDYYQNDYVRSASNIQSSVSTDTTGYYNGLIKATRWRIKDENEINASTALYTESSTNKELMYNYTYDDFYRFETATFGVYDNSSNAFTSQNDYKVYGGSNDDGIDYDIIGNINNLYRNSYDNGSGLIMDSLEYSYTSLTSQLAAITDHSSSSSMAEFKTTGADNFTYNNLGQMTASEADSVSTVAYYPNGQVKKVTFDNGNTAEYYYNERNIKIKSKFTDSGASTTKYNWYITDASGALKSVYDSLYAATPVAISLTQQAVYGGGRLGMYDVSGDKLNYEITDHLGNVRLTIRDIGTYDTTEIDVVSWADYYPFGEVLPGRNSDPTGMFGYQGQERVSNSTNNVNGSRWYNFNLRMYNPSLGRFNTIDPYSQFNSPYLAMANNPISFVDPDGGRAILTQWQKYILSRGLQRRMHKGDYYGKSLEFLRHWESITGSSWHGMNADDVYAYGVEYGYDAMVGKYQLYDIMGGITAPGGPNLVGHGPQTNPSDRPDESGKYIDGMKVSDFAFNSFIDNTLREDIVDVQTNQVGFSMQDGMWNATHNMGKDIFGSGKTNRQVREEKNRKVRQETKLKYKVRKQIKTLLKAESSLVPEQSVLYASLKEVISTSQDLTYLNLYGWFKAGNGRDFMVSEYSFNDLVVTIGSDLNFKNLKAVIGTENLFSLTVDAEGTKYNNLLGKFSYYINETGIVGMSDYWNFDKQEGRTTINELKTSFGRNFLNGTSFWILYGVYPNLDYRPGK